MTRTEIEKLASMMDEADLFDEPTRPEVRIERIAAALEATGLTLVEEGRVEALEKEVSKLKERLNSPEVNDFMAGAILEAGHQIERWGDDHDKDKVPADWFWTLGYLGGKALRAHQDGNIEKLKHHTITSAALLANWHRTARSLTEGT